ncbi:condensation domain-containing protein [Proteiniclasticum sp.]|uniref:condensation domain-containing protein n=1 Tax=Proteiniclasticum sp. TaxID=2053595 RepID=UPI002899B65E|nr:condensation domain-containing protein [Proteiniclasticum sp.]
MPDLFPLSMSQYTLIIGLLSNSDLKNSGRLNTLTCCFEWKKGSAELLSKIGNQLLEKNDAFRLRPVYHFPWKWKQYIAPYEKEVFPLLKFDDDETYESWLMKAKDNDVRLLKDKLYDFRILERADNGFTLWIQMNHFLTDGYSMKLMANQIRALDRFYTTGETGIVKEPGSYRDHVEKERSYRKSPQFKEDRAYWKKVFRYHKDFSFPAGSRSMKIHCDTKSITVEGDLYRKLVSFCRDNGLSVSSALMSGSAMTANSITAATRFSMATLSYGRNDGVLRRTMGCMMNSPVMMYSVDPSKSFTEFCRKNYEDNLEMLRHLRYSSLDFTPLSYALCMSHGMNFNHSWILFSQMDYESAFVDADPKGRMFWSNTNVSQFYAAIFDVPKEERVTLELRYQTKRFSENTIEKLLSSNYNILTLLLHEPDLPMREVLK